MPPKKDQLSPVDLRRKAHSHGIRFPGPVPPSAWPNEYKHNFEVIRALQFLRYQKRVKELRERVRYLLKDINPNESSWRKLEDPIFGIFDDPVIWYVLDQTDFYMAELT
ncbi:unnamed protein product [Alternaria alternata]